MSHIGRRIFAALTRDMTPDEADRRTHDMLFSALALAVVLIAWLSALYIASNNQDALDRAHEEGRLQAWAEAKARAQREQEAWWLPQMTAAYQQGLQDECERQTRTAASRQATALPCRSDAR